MNQPKIKLTKVRVSPVVSVGVLLVVVGVAIGALWFNSLVPSVLTPAPNATVSAAAATGWTAAANFTSLFNAIAAGADVKAVNNLSSGTAYKSFPCLAIYSQSAQITCFINDSTISNLYVHSSTFGTSTLIFKSGTPASAFASVIWYYKY